MKLPPKVTSSQRLSLTIEACRLQASNFRSKYVDNAISPMPKSKPSTYRPPRSKAHDSSSGGSRTLHTSPLRPFFCIFSPEAMTQPNDNTLPSLETATSVVEIVEPAFQEFGCCRILELACP